jgi:hypothetical protein
MGMDQQEEWVPTPEQLKRIEQGAKDIREGKVYGEEEARAEIRRRVREMNRIVDQDSA